jgi:hypothetical protein
MLAFYARGLLVDERTISDIFSFFLSTSRVDE